jgi:ABC-type multidrug transport system permease subunit
VLFAILSIVLFVAIGLVVKSYRFQFSLERDVNAPLKQWFFWLVAMTFVAYFGHGFLFVSGISRFILIWTALLSGVVISLVDSWYSGWVTRVESRSPMSVLCVYQDKKQLAVFSEQ